MQNQINFTVCPTGLLIILIAHLMLLTHYGMKAWEHHTGWDLVPAIAYVMILAVLGVKVWAKWRNGHQARTSRLLSRWALGFLLVAHFALFATYFATGFAEEEYSNIFAAAGYLGIFLLLYYKAAQSAVYQRHREKRKIQRKPHAPTTNRLQDAVSNFGPVESDRHAPAS